MDCICHTQLCDCAATSQKFEMVNYLQNTKSLVRYAFINEILVGRFNEFTLVR